MPYVPVVRTGIEFATDLTDIIIRHDYQYFRGDVCFQWLVRCEESPYVGDPQVFALVP